MKGQVSSEHEIQAPASKAWKLYSRLELGKLVEEKLPLFEKVDVLGGDGGVGTIVKITFSPDVDGLSPYKEKFTKIDDEHRIKEAEGVEGGYMDLGFTLYRVRFEIIEKGLEKCIIKSTIEYELNEDAASRASDLVSIKVLEDIAILAASHLHEG